MPIDPNCWVELQSPTSAPRPAQVTSSPSPLSATTSGTVAPGTTLVPIDGDVYVDTTKHITYVYDDKAGWLVTSQRADKQFWGHGDPTAAGRTAPANPVPGEAFLDQAGVMGVWNGTAWAPDTDIRAGDEYIDIDTGTVYALTP